ncbi:MAG: response regulator [Candidatus Stahlbacteria bacterium]|nr:MAG: response regulator [Candidatus Stahlbacteria bacterium]
MSRILVVEDNEGNLELIRVVLEMAGYEVIGTSSADVGLLAARKAHPDLILMDMHLPGMDGYEATRIIKGDKELKHIPVIAVTAVTDRTDEERVRACGCEGFIAKPVDTRSLAAQIAEFLKLGGVEPS